MKAVTLPQRPPHEFADVPADANGGPLYCATDAEDFEAYIAWLADYLYRPAADATPLALQDAWSQVASIETEIASWIWEHPWEDYPPDNYQLRHADILHRPQLSHILSRVVLHNDRRELLHRFYWELAVDSCK